MSATKRFKLAMLGAMFAGGVAVSPVAQADAMNGIVDVWNVDVNAIFDITSVVWQAGETAGTVVNNKLIQWGSGSSGPSSLAIGDSPSNVNINTNGAAVANISVTHANNPIGSTTGELDSVKIISTLTLTPASPAGTGFPPVPQTFTILFDETPNDDNPCIAGGANDQGVNINGCADVFVIDKDSLNFPFFYDMDGPGGSLPNQQYFISFFELTNALQPLSPAACATAGATSPCKGFLTPEEATTRFQFAAVITTTPVQIVPEPGTLAVLSAGLIALGAMRRRRRA